jgi:hypothetical protein
MRREIQFTNWQDINRQIGRKSVAFFGAGNIAEKTKRRLPDTKLITIFDNASNLWDEEVLDVKVSDPVKLNTLSKRPFIIITTTSFREIWEQLENMGMEPNKDFAVSPILNDLRIIDELESIERQLIFTSGSPRQESDKYGGGVYEMTIQKDTFTHQKKISGNCYGLAAFNGNYVTVDTERGIFEFDSNYKIVRKSELPSGARAHGVHYDSDSECFFVTCSYRDSVLVINKDFKIINEISISFKSDRYGQPVHHCNDCYVWKDSIFISMFSLTGNWKLDIFDGGVLEVDIKTHKIIGPVAQKLWMPHNITMINGGFTILDSLTGNLLANNLTVIGNFPAFSRGLAHDGQFHYIGQSRNRNFSKNFGLSNNISIDAGIIIFDEHTKVSRFLQLPPRISEIHAIQVL